VKRTFDLLATAAALLVLLLPMLAIALAVRLRLGRPVFFVQLRPGRHGVPFSLIKFRTMREAYDEKGEPLPEEERLTRLGRFLRATSLDELPELWNVLRGEMSLVGPRPLLMEYLPLYTPEQARRHDVRPGLTGWAQINGRNAISREEKFALDLWYVDQHSMLVDLKILWATLIKVIRSEGISPADREIMERFAGSPPSSMKVIPRGRG
jgi:lipopolysaccharide/colanic/teichoic acid biosynthesis glycosyltransferase